MKSLNMKALAAEFIGTLILTLLGTGVAVVYAGASTVAGIVATCLTFGLTIVAIYYSVGKVSGGHVNPAVSLAIYFDGRMSLVDLITYIIAQCLGALAGSGILFAILKQIPSAAITTLGLGQNGYGTASSVNLTMTGAIITELVLTTIFVLVVLTVSDDDRYTATGGLAIGGALALVHFLGLSLTGTSVNPARSLAPALVLAMIGETTALSQVWVFILAPLLGGIIAAVLYKFVIKDNA